VFTLYILELDGRFFTYYYFKIKFCYSICPTRVVASVRNITAKD
jgi:hypothetical protein